MRHAADSTVSKVHRRRAVAAVGAGVAALALILGFGAADATTNSEKTTNAESVAYPIPDGALFVSTSGNDGNSGTEAQPLRTLTAAVGKVAAGGTIVMRGGVYREGMGGVNKRITVQPYPNENVKLKGSDVVADWTADAGDWRATTWTSPLCQTCYPEGAIDPAHPLAGKPDQVFRNGTPVRQVGSRAEVVPGTFFIDPSSKALYVGDNPAGAVVEASVRWRAMLLNPGAAGSAIRGLTFTEYAPHWNENQLSVLVVDAPNSVIENNVFNRSAGRALGVYNSGVTVTGNQVVDNGATGGNFNRAHNVVIRGNTFSRNNNVGFAVSTCGMVCTMAGLKMAHTDNPTVEDNVFADNDGSGYWCDLGCTDGTITGNEVLRNSNNGIYWEVSARATISDNEITGNGRGVKIAGSDHVTITGNRLTGNRTQLGIYDDARSPSTDPYSAGLGLTWDTANTVITANTIDGSAATTLLMDTNRTVQVNAAQMIERATDNGVSGNETIHWCPSTTCTRYPTVAAFASATGIPFGSATTPPANQLTDPGFEADPPVWGAFGTSVVLTSVTAARSGSRALQIGTTGAAPVTAGATNGGEQVPTVTGRTYSASCWVRSASAVKVRIQVQEYTPAWERVTAPAPSAPVTLSNPNMWYQVTLTYTATTTGNILPLSVFSHDLAAGGATLLVDDCSLGS